MGKGGESSKVSEYQSAKVPEWQSKEDDLANLKL